MTSKLIKIRDEKADQYGVQFKAYPKSYPRDDFHAGFQACYEQLAPLIEALNQILKKKPHAVNQNEAADTAIEFQAVAREALKKIEGE